VLSAPIISFADVFIALSFSPIGNIRFGSVVQEALLDPEGVVSQLSVPPGVQIESDHDEYEKDLEGDADDSGHCLPSYTNYRKLRAAVQIHSHQGGAVVRVVKVTGLGRPAWILSRRGESDLVSLGAVAANELRRRQRCVTYILANAVFLRSGGIAALQFVEQNQYDDAHADREDREHNNQLLAIHTCIPSS